MTRLRKLSFAIMAAAVLTSAAAQARPFTPSMTCGAAANTVSIRGAIVMSTGRGTFDRFVISPAYCTPQEYTKAAFVPTANDPQCFIGYTCEQRLGPNRR